MAPTVTTSQSRRSPLGCGEKEIVISTDLQQLRDALMSIWTKVSEECFQHSIKVVLKAKVGPTFKQSGGPDKASDECGHTFSFKTSYLEAQQLCSFTFIIHEEN